MSSFVDPSDMEGRSTLRYLHEVKPNATLPPPERLTEAYGDRNFLKMAIELANGDDMKKQSLLMMQDILAMQTDVVKALKTDIMLKLSDLLKSADPELRLLSVQVVGQLAKSPVGRKSIIEYSYGADIVRLLTDEFSEIRFHSYECLKSLSETRDGLASLSNEVFIGSFIQQTRSEEDVVLRVSAFALLDKIMHVSQGLTLTLDSDIIGACVQNLTHTFEHVRSAACQCLMTANSRYTARDPTMKAGAVPLLIELLKDRDLYVRAFAAGVLMYIGMELEGKELCLKDGPSCLELLVSQLDENFDTLLLNSIQCLASLAEDPRGRAILNQETIIKHLEYFALVDLRPLLKTTAARALQVIQWTP